MAQRFDSFLVIDLEAACWMGPPPKGMENEIIEIGLAEVDLTKADVVSSERLIIKPKYSKISKFCTKLTSITPQEASKGLSFKKACQILDEKYWGRSRGWGSWGNFDRNKFEEQCKTRKIDYPLGISHINIKNLFSIMFRLDHEYGLKNALKHLDIPLEGRHHRGVDDALNTARIFCEILKMRRS